MTEEDSNEEFRKDDQVEVYSKSEGCWYQGKIKEVYDDGYVLVAYNDNMEKELPIESPDLRLKKKGHFSPPKSAELYHDFPNEPKRISVADTIDNVQQIALIARSMNFTKRDEDFGSNFRGDANAIAFQQNHHLTYEEAGLRWYQKSNFDEVMARPVVTPKLIGESPIEMHKSSLPPASSKPDASINQTNNNDQKQKIIIGSIILVVFALIILYFSMHTSESEEDDEEGDEEEGSDDDDDDDDGDDDDDDDDGDDDDESRVAEAEDNAELNKDTDTRRMLFDMIQISAGYIFSNYQLKLITVVIILVTFSIQSLYILFKSR